MKITKENTKSIVASLINTFNLISDVKTDNRLNNLISNLIYIVHYKQKKRELQLQKEDVDEVEFASTQVSINFTVSFTGTILYSIITTYSTIYDHRNFSVEMAKTIVDSITTSAVMSLALEYVKTEEELKEVSNEVCRVAVQTGCTRDSSLNDLSTKLAELMKDVINKETRMSTTLAYDVMNAFRVLFCKENTDASIPEVESFLKKVIVFIIMRSHASLELNCVELYKAATGEPPEAEELFADLTKSHLTYITKYVTVMKELDENCDDKLKFVNLCIAATSLNALLEIEEFLRTSDYSRYKEQPWFSTEDLLNNLTYVCNYKIAGLELEVVEELIEVGIDASMAKLTETLYLNTEEEKSTLSYTVRKLQEFNSGLIDTVNFAHRLGSSAS